MKTITIRLSEVEAWALDRLAGVNGLSKNKQIANLIVKAYRDIDPGAGIIDGELIDIADDYYWARDFIELSEHKGTVKKEIATAIKVIRYVLENPGDISEDELKELEARRASLLQEYREA